MHRHVLFHFFPKVYTKTLKKHVPPRGNGGGGVKKIKKKLKGIWKINKKVVHSGYVLANRKWFLIKQKGATA